MIKRQAEPFLWMLFSMGGVAAALMLPMLLLIFGVAVPLGWIAAPGHAHLSAVISHPLTRLVLIGVCTVSLFHWAHRFRYTLYDGLQVQHLNEVVAVACYGTAIVGSFAAAYLLIVFP